MELRECFLHSLHASLPLLSLSTVWRVLCSMQPVVYWVQPCLRKPMHAEG